MRHRNAISNSPFHGMGEKVYAPYSLTYGNGRTYRFTSGRDTMYKQVLQYVAEHPKCKRVEIVTAIWPHVTSGSYKMSIRGYQSKLFALLLFFDYIDYDKNFRYTITHKGRALLNPSILKVELSEEDTTWLYYNYGTNLVAKNPKPTHKYVQHLRNMRNAGLASARDICFGIKNPASHEFVQYCKLGFAEKLRNTETNNVYYRITAKGRDLLKRAYA